MSGITTKVGLPPGTLVHIGKKTTEKIKITVIDYDETHIQEKEVKAIKECIPFKDAPTVTWINIDGIHNLDIIQELGAAFDIHPLTLEDIVHTGQRPKIEDFTDYLFLVLKMFYFDENRRIRAEQISLLLGPQFVISFQEREGDVFDPVRERIKNGKSHVRKMSSDYLAYALIDAIVDNYFTILEVLGEEIEEIQEELVADPTTEMLQIIQTLKREVIMLRRSVWPLREVVNKLERGESVLIKESTSIYLRDVYDHTIRVMDTIETFRDMLSGMLDIYLSSISNKLNQIMKVLTIIATIFIPLTFITGLYGMNFKYMPELAWEWGYPVILAIMGCIGIFMLLYFKKEKWL